MEFNIKSSGELHQMINVIASVLHDYILHKGRSLIPAAGMCFMAMSAYAIESPPWWGNNIGKDEIVLPGFEGVRTEGNTVILGEARKYVWGQGVVPDRMLSRNEQYVTGNKLIVVINGRKHELEAKQIEVVQTSPHHVIVNATTIVEDSLEVGVTTRIEYDGMAFVEVKLKPLKKVNISELSNFTEVKSNTWTKMQAYRLNDVHKRQKQVVFEPAYKGALLSVLSIVDGSRSFWWFVDNTSGWVGKGDITEVVNSDGKVKITQKFINRNIVLEREKIIRYNFLVTPIKHETGNQRKYRFARTLSDAEALHHGVNLWWVDAFALQNYPYTELKSSSIGLVPENIRKRYRGLAYSRQRLREADKQNIKLLPYFSAHTLSHVDPVYIKYKNRWAVQPVKTWRNRKYDPPYEFVRKDMFLSHNKDGYSDYLLYRFSELIDKLGMDGMYFDQGSPMPTSMTNIWETGSSSADEIVSTDILSLREFFKRLATLFYLKGKQGLIFVHNSNSAIVPAYTFASSMVQGEVFEHRLQNYDYIKSIDIDEVRSRLSGASYGLTSMWQELIYANDSRLEKSKRPYQMGKEEWFESIPYRKAYDGFMALSLLHDIPNWAYAPVSYRNSIFNDVDWVEPENSEFIGYWQLTDSNNNNVYYSVYSNADKGRLLIVVSNLNKTAATVSLNDYLKNIQEKKSLECSEFKSVSDQNQKSQGGKNINIPAENYRLFKYDCVGGSNANI